MPSSTKKGNITIGSKETKSEQQSGNSCYACNSQIHTYTKEVYRNVPYFNKDTKPKTITVKRTCSGSISCVVPSAVDRIGWVISRTIYAEPEPVSVLCVVGAIITVRFYLSRINNLVSIFVELHWY